MRSREMKRRWKKESDGEQSLKQFVRQLLLSKKPEDKNFAKAWIEVKRRSR